jgi:copper chaperone CopZ
VNCEVAARVALRRVDGVESAEVSFESGRAVVTFDPNVTTPAQFIAELERMTGFTATVLQPACDGCDPQGGLDEKGEGR